MEVTIRHSPSNAIARCALAGGEVLKVQPDAMVAHSPGMSLSAAVDGGVLKGLKRKALGGESFFVSTWTAPAEGGWVDVATYLLGDSFSLEVSEGHGLLISRGGWVASSTDIAIDAKWGGLKNLMGGEGGFIVRATGTGTIVLAWLRSPGHLGPRSRRDLRPRHEPHGRLRRVRQLHAPARRRGEVDPVAQERRGLGLRVHRPGPGLRADALAAVADEVAGEHVEPEQQLADGRRCTGVAAESLAPVS